ncbi:hypothetical protein Ade02nite_29090 [Paractinoplanes deccanensis]|uniref:Uncharacterized protein n=1 Tax=Paractinoplanes deccanensis TaxID=113561 RepID=A0ABQ3Y2S3_9ACTN|nr:DUF6188 family protein [Actinoplanes deccanensis]GID74268.1 hypothetical protein Ade02nite_29090 [Actinoplanes deccanensis]
MSPLIPLAGQHLDYVRLGDALVLSFSRGSQILIETAAHLTTPAGRTSVTPAAHDEDALAPFLGDAVQTAHTDKSGALTVTFAAGSALEVRPDPDVESWAFTNPDGPLIVCLPGGELAVWANAGAGVTTADLRAAP